jgi:hypothetical protein
VSGLLGSSTFAANVWIIPHHKSFLHMPPIGKWWWLQVEDRAKIQGKWVVVNVVPDGKETTGAGEVWDFIDTT